MRKAAKPRPSRKTQQPKSRVEKALDDRVWLSMPQVAAHFSTGREQVRRWLNSGKLEAIRVGKLVRINREEVADFERRHRIGGVR